MSFDLHTHTAFSDGTDTPADLMATAQRIGLAGVAITDHDSTASWGASAAARPDGLALIRGSELSTHVWFGDRRVSIHLLAYLFDPAASDLADELGRLQRDRLHRAMAMVDRMVADGVPISRNQVLDIAGGAPVGRPHIGRALMARGLVASVTEAFGTYLSFRGPYYVHKSDLDLLRAIELVRAAGGVPVIAHPRARGAAIATSAHNLRRWKSAGLVGVEVDHPDHSVPDRMELTTIAAELGLVATGASDYHGTNKAVALGAETTQAATVSALVAHTSGVTEVLGPSDWLT